MFKHLLVPTDGTKLAVKAVGEGVALARALGAEVTILTVLKPFHVFSLNAELVTATAGLHRGRETAHERDDIRLAHEATASGLRCSQVEAKRDHISDAVIEAAAERGCDLIVMPAHERVGLISSSHLDTETARLLERSDLPVLVLHEAGGA